MVWLGYDYAWGGTYQRYYKEQSLNGIAIQDYELQPIKFQGRILDIETGLHYNRFRYYDSDVGMFIQRDPIGLLGGVNVFAYAPNPVGWVDPWGLMNVTGKTPQGMNRVSTQWRTQYGPSLIREHHLIPQKMMRNKGFMNQMKNAGYKNPENFIHRQIAQIPNSQHISIHKSGWNKSFDEWYRNNPNFTKKDLQEAIKNLMKEYNVPKNSRNYAKFYGKKC